MTPLQVLANFLSTPLASGIDGDALGWPYVAFDLDPSVVKVNEILFVLLPSLREELICMNEIFLKYCRL